jgi:hypothetical protein
MPPRSGVSPPTRLVAALLVAAALRVCAIAVSDREVADVQRYRKVADHVLDVSLNPYQAPRLYPYPPVWVWVEAGAGWAARHGSLPFSMLVKLPTLCADLFIVAWLFRRTRTGAWAYVLHPVALMVGAFHGQFDATALAFVLAALGALEKERPDRAALCLAAAIALKSFPVLLLPLFLMARPGWRERARFAALALLPVGALVLPYALHDAGAVRRELLGYGGVADFGWIGVWRAAHFLMTNALARSEAARWPLAVAVGKSLFLAAYAAALLVFVRRRVPPLRASLIVFLLFLTLYGAVSAQYLLWVVPLACLWPNRWMALHGAACTVALVGFYCFLAPGVLFSGDGPLRLEASALLWVAGIALVLITGGLWLALLLAGRAPRQAAPPAPV